MRTEDTHSRNHPFRALTVSALAIIILSLLAAGIWIKRQTKNEPQIISQSRLEKIIRVSKLSTFETIYNGIAEVESKENADQIDYYVYYESRVKAGIDFKQVGVQVDNEAKKITVKMPEIEITDVNVDIASLEYIFENKKANTPTVSQEAYKACQADVLNEVENEPDIYELAEQNAENVISALIRPFVEQVDAEYVLEID